MLLVPCGLLLGCATATGIEREQIPPGMVYIPSGYFLMGSVQELGLRALEAGVDEFPQHRVILKAFWIDQSEVTVDQYRRFVQATGNRPPPIWEDLAYPQPTPTHPVIDVSWFDAEAHCRWVRKRLPTEAEWEKAARGTDGRVWPWGEFFNPEKANVLDSGKGWTMPVGSFEEDLSAYGVLDMAGNAMEWTSSWYQPYPGSRLDRVAFGEKYRVIKGGAWNTPALPFSRAANRYAVAPKWDHPNQGFRCAKDAR
ncbi:MAG: formylglycine-generating enzyme family protein [Nitrospiria bacterium]